MCGNNNKWRSGEVEKMSDLSCVKKKGTIVLKLLTCNPFLLVS